MRSKNSISNRRDFLRASAATLAAGAIPAFASSAFDSTEGSGPPSSLPAKPQRIIIDTDPGVDDAMAIFLALRSPELKVEAITAVSGNVPLASLTVTTMFSPGASYALTPRSCGP